MGALQVMPKNTTSSLYHGKLVQHKNTRRVGKSVNYSKAHTGSLRLYQRQTVLQLNGKSNMKPSEIIRIAMNHSSYLSSGGRDYLCHVIKNELALADDEETMVSLVIYDSIKTREHNHSALDSYLWETGKIPDSPNIHKTQEYRQAAFAHWNALIEKLEKEGR